RRRSGDDLRQVRRKQGDRRDQEPRRGGLVEGQRLNRLRARGARRTRTSPRARERAARRRTRTNRRARERVARAEREASFSRARGARRKRTNRRSREHAARAESGRALVLASAWRAPNASGGAAWHPVPARFRGRMLNSSGQLVSFLAAHSAYRSEN